MTLLRCQQNGYTNADGKNAANRNEQRNDQSTLDLHEGYIFPERPSLGIAGWRGGWIAGNGSEGTRPAPLPAGPVPEWWNVKSVFIETPDGPAINCTSLFGLFLMLLILL